MRIKRVDEKTVKCFLSNEELEAYEIDYQDFITHTEKAKQVVQDILNQAEAEVGYKPPRVAFDMQIMVLRDQGILLTLSENDGTVDHAKRLMDYLKTMQQHLMEAGVTPGELNAIFPEMPAMEKAEQSVEVKASEPSDRAIFAFASILDVMNYAAILPTTLRIESALYEVDGKFYLILQKGAASYERFSRACIQALDFGRLHSAEASQELYLEEHGTCLIAEKAVRKLRGKKN